MPDHATPNLPSRDFDRTEAFYAALGFEQSWRDHGWMILKRGGLALEFFPFPDLDPATSSFGCCLRLDDLDGFYAACEAAGIREGAVQPPRLHRPAAVRPAHRRPDRPRRDPVAPGPEPGLNAQRAREALKQRATASLALAPLPA